LKSGMTLLDIIPSYDSLLPEPYLPQAEIVRLMPPDLHPERIQFNLGGLMAGDQNQNLVLQDQDRVIIYDIWEKTDIPEVTIEGAARNPGTYRLYRGMRIKNLIFQAGNLRNGAYTEKASLSRVVPGSTGTAITEINFSPKRAMAGLSPDNILLEKDDSVRIREIPQYNQALGQKVYLEGEFMFPGEYTFSDGDRLSSVIENAGGVTEHAYPFGAIFHRESVKKLQEDRLKDYINNLEEDILTMSSQEAGKALDMTQAEILKETLDSRKQLVEKLKSARPTGRMVVDLLEILTDPSASSNLELRTGDRLVIEKKPDSVNVMGEVYNPTAMFAEKNKTVNYYLEEVGGITPNGDKKQIYVVKANGSVISKTQESFFGMTTWDSGNRRWVMGFESTRLDPGDTIIVPKRVQVYPWLRVTKDITQILYQVAVGAGVIIAAFD
jgi:polysaccharide export outer membrane protein